MVGFTVGDMDRAIAFYTSVLDFHKVSDVEVAGSAYEELDGVFGVRMRVVRLRLGDESLQFDWNPGTTAGARLRAPEQAIQVAMPAHKRLGTGDREQVAPLDEPRQRDQGDPRRVVGATRSNLTFEIAGELLSQEQVLGCELRTGTEHQRQQTQEVSKKGTHSPDHARR